MTGGLRAAVAACAVVAAACGGSGDVEVGDDPGGLVRCDPARREALAPDAFLHVTDPNADVVYDTDPPTSGPHTKMFDGPLYRRTLTGPEQIGVIEDGDVLVQYRPADLATDEVARLEALAEGRVNVAPNPDLRDVVVLTTWTVSQSCDGLAPAVVAAFDREFGRTLTTQP